LFWRLLLWEKTGGTQDWGPVIDLRGLLTKETMDETVGPVLTAPRGERVIPGLDAGWYHYKLGIAGFLAGLDVGPE